MSRVRWVKVSKNPIVPVETRARKVVGKVAERQRQEGAKRN